MAHYVKNADLQKELERCHKLDRVTNEAVKMFQLMIGKLSWNLPYKDKELKRDVQSWAMYVCCKNWKKYDMSKNSAFSYFTSIILNGLRAGFKKYTKGGNGEIHISIDSLMNSNANES